MLRITVLTCKIEYPDLKARRQKDCIRVLQKYIKAFPGQEMPRMLNIPVALTGKKYTRAMATHIMNCVNYVYRVDVLLLAHGVETEDLGIILTKVAEMLGTKVIREDELDEIINGNKSEPKSESLKKLAERENG